MYVLFILFLSFVFGQSSQGSNLASQQPLPEGLIPLEGKVLYTRASRDSKTGVFKKIPVYKSLKKMQKLEAWPSGLKVFVRPVDKKGNWKHSTQPIELHSKLYVFAEVDKEHQDKVQWQKGYILAKHLHQKGIKEGIKNLTPWTSENQDFRKTPQVCLKDCNEQKITEMVQDFHNSLCNDIASDEPQLREALIESWQRYIKQLPKKFHKLGYKAMRLDLVARTVLYESHPPGQLDDIQEELGQCEWDLITLSIYNRGRICRNYMSCHSFKKDPYIGAALAPTQYHIWRQEHLKNTYITSCFLREDLAVKPLLGLNTEEAERYHKVRRSYPKLLERVAMVLGLEKFKGKRLNKEVRKFFEVTTVDGKELPKNWLTKRGEHLLNYTHYYHRGGLLNCRAENYFRTRYIDAAEVQYEQGTRLVPGILINERVDFGSQSSANKRLTEILFTRKMSGGRLNYEPLDELLGKKAFIDKRVTRKDKNTLYTCLPQGQLPSCLGEGALKAPLYGKRVPTTWFNSQQKKDILKMYQSLKIDLGRHWKRRRQSKGVALGVRCLRSMKKPEFKGLCDPNFMPVSGAD